MSLSPVFEKLGSQVMPKVLGAVSNGEVRVLESSGAGAVDAQGFPTPGYTPRTAGFIPCVWKDRANVLDSEAVVAAQIRGIARYKISVPRFHEGDPVLIGTHDRIELRQTVGAATAITLEVVGPVNNSNVVWEVRANDIDVG